MKREGGSCRDQNLRDFWFKWTAPEVKRAKVEGQAGQKEFWDKELKKELKEWRMNKCQKKTQKKESSCSLHKGALEESVNLAVQTRNRCWALFTMCAMTIIQCIWGRKHSSAPEEHLLGDQNDVLWKAKGYSSIKKYKQQFANIIWFCYQVYLPVVQIQE